MPNIPLVLFAAAADTPNMPSLPVWREQPVALLQRIPADGVEDELDPAFARDLAIPRIKSTVLWSIR